MGRRVSHWFASFVAMAAVLSISYRISASDRDLLGALRQEFLHPPDDTRIMMRWWWFGPSIEHAELERELRAMKQAGIGGVEIQPVYPVALDDSGKEIHTSPYSSAAFLEAVHFTAKTAAALGVRVDITLGSGWPYGGPDTPVSQAAGHLRYERLPVPEGASSVPLPSLENGEQFIGAFVGGQFVSLEQGRRITIPPGLSGADVLLCFISSRTGQQVKRASIGAEGFVLDHYDPNAIDTHLKAVAEPLLKAFAEHPPHAVFSDSLEVYGSDWTPAFLEEFRRRRGYDVTPYLPVLVTDGGRQTEAVRHDWGKTLTELAEDNYLKPLREWAHAHGTLFRSQTYGEPPVILSSNALVDLPEGEHGPSWRRFSAARWASSACHLYGKPVVSTETWTWLHSPSFRATPLDLKAEADRHFVEGINQLVGHGWPYSPPQAGEPGWRFYAAAALNDHNPWFQVMPDLAQYLQRVSFLMRQGKPANNIGIYVPTDDAWAHLQPGKTAVDETVDTLLGPVVVPAVLDSGYNFDFIDDRAIAAVGVPYKLLILPGVERMPLETLQRLQKYVASGGRLIATRALPSLAPGLLEEKRDSAAVASLAQTLFSSAANTRLVEQEQQLPAALIEMLPPDLIAAGDSPAIGFMHRKLPDAEIYFVANTSNRAVKTVASVRVSGLEADWWDPLTGETFGADAHPEAGRTSVRLRLAPYESRVLVFHRGAPSTKRDETSLSPTGTALDWSADWKVTFPAIGYATHFDHLRSWTENDSTRYFSGQATYTKTVEISASQMIPRARLFLEFGNGAPVDPGTSQPIGMRALLESPVRESAEVWVNGKRAADVWLPPYESDVTGLLHPGTNQLRIVVANSAINVLAQGDPPDYRLLNLRYGERFVPQDMQHVQPLPSGMLGGVHLQAKVPAQ